MQNKFKYRTLPHLCRRCSLYAWCSAILPPAASASRSWSCSKFRCCWSWGTSFAWQTLLLPFSLLFVSTECERTKHFWGCWSWSAIKHEKLSLLSGRVVVVEITHRLVCGQAHTSGRVWKGVQPRELSRVAVPYVRRPIMAKVKMLSLRESPPKKRPLNTLLFLITSKTTSKTTEPIRPKSDTRLVVFTTRLQKPRTRSSSRTVEREEERRARARLLSKWGLTDD